MLHHNYALSYDPKYIHIECTTRATRVTKFETE